MTSSHCRAPLTYERYLQYFMGELVGEAEQTLEEHLFTCEACAASAERWGNDTLALERTARRELPQPAMTREQLAALGDRAVLVELPDAPSAHFELEHGKIHVFHLSLDAALLASFERLTAEYGGTDSEPIFYVSDVPVTAGSGDVFLACHGHILEGHGGPTNVRLLGLREGQASTVYQSTLSFDVASG